MYKTKDVLPDLFEPPDLLIDRYVSDVCKQTQYTINTFPAPARLPSPRYAASEFLKFLFHVCWVVEPRRGPGGTAALQPQSRRGVLTGSTHHHQSAHCEHHHQHEQPRHRDIEQPDTGPD